MAALTEQKIQIVRTLVEQAPDPVVGKLQAALAHAGGDEMLASVRQLVDLEASDRRLRNAVLAPIAAMCLADGKTTERLTFPAAVLGLLWRGLKREAPKLVAEARDILRDLSGADDPKVAFDELTRLAAAGLRAGTVREFASAGQAAEAARPNGADTLATCLDLSPVVRQACQRLPDWINRMTEEETAQVRVAFKDAVAVRTDAGPLFFEMLSAQLAHPYQVLRIISAVMDGPDEHYFAASESALFAVRLMDLIDAELAELAATDFAGGLPAAHAAASCVERAVEQIGELSLAIELDREGGWGRRVARQKTLLAQGVETRFKELERALGAALPTRQERVARRLKAVPKLSGPPDEATTQRVLGLLQFAEDIRASAGHGGFASSRAKLMERLGESVSSYAEELLDRMRHGEVESEEIARAYLSVAADCAALIHGPKAGEVIRRRASAG